MKGKRILPIYFFRKLTILILKCTNMIVFMYREYYCGIKERISTMKLCFHYLLHVADSIRNTGPCWATWQFPMERVCGMLLLLAKSRLHPYKNIINSLHLLELFNYLPYRQEIYKQIFSPHPPKKYTQHL